jgi:hypothetical protein
MAVSDEFNANNYKASKINGFVLGIQYTTGGGSTTYLAYDFMARVLIVRTGSSDGGAAVKSFAELDRDSLISMRDKLVQLGGNPPELPPEASAVPAQKKLNL